MEKRKIYKTKKSRSLSKINPKYIKVAVLALIAIIVIVAIFLVIKKRPIEDHTYVPSTDLEKYDYYVGPKDHEDRGLWTTPEEYYSLFNKDAKETNIINALFGAGDKKGLVPVGIRVTPVLLTYNDYEPYDGPMQHGYLDAYSVETMVGSEALFEPIEYKWGLEEPDLALSGGYNITKDKLTYQSSVGLNIADVEYYMLDSFDPSAETESIGISKGNYGFLEPYFNFKYDGWGESSYFDENGKLLATKTFGLSGCLEDAIWEFTANLTGQEEGLFKTGSVYIRCKLPCTVNEIRYNEPKNSADIHEDFVNIYFKIDNVMIGTWIDCESSN